MDYRTWNNDRSIALLESITACHPYTFPKSKELSGKIITLTGIIHAFLSKYDLWEQGIFQDYYDGTILGLQFKWLDQFHNSLDNICWAFLILERAGVITFTPPRDNSTNLTIYLQTLLATKITRYILFHEDKLSQFQTDRKES